jgi:hypothetical protein
MVPAEIVLEEILFAGSGRADLPAVHWNVYIAQVDNW